MPTWPETLPQRFLKDSVTETLGDNVLRSQPDQGPAKMRRRTITNTVRLTGAMAMTHSQWDTFLSFYQDTLGEVLSFDMPTPFDEEEMHSVRFTAAPQRVPLSPARVRVQMELEIMPS